MAKVQGVQRNHRRHRDRGCGGHFSDGSARSPRYYQQIAINRTVEAIARNDGNNRHLLVMATGTGKTYAAFQIIYRLWKSGLKKRILFLADRTALIDQTVRNDFRHFKEAMTVIKHRQIDTAYNIYLALYQGLSDNNATPTLTRSSARVLRSRHRGRVPSRQRPRKQQVAGDSGLLQGRDTYRPHRHAKGDHRNHQRRNISAIRYTPIHSNRALTTVFSRPIR